MYLHVECSQLKVKVVTIRTLFMGVSSTHGILRQVPQSPPRLGTNAAISTNNESLTRTVPMTHEQTYMKESNWSLAQPNITCH